MKDRKWFLAILVSMTLTSCDTARLFTQPVPTQGGLVMLTMTPEPILAVTPTATPSLQIALLASREETDERDIVLWDPESDAVIRVTDDDANEDPPRWSPDGTTLVFSSDQVSQRGLYLYNVLLNKLQILLQDENFNFGASWSPDGSSVVFSALHDVNNDNERARIKILRLSDGKIETLLLRSGWDYSFPQYSPDGLSIYSVATLNGTTDIVVRAIASSDETRLPFLEMLTDFRLSPDGTRIALGTWQGVCLAQLASHEDNCSLISEGTQVAYDWDDTGEILYYADISQSGSTVMSYSLATGARQVIGHIDGWHALSMSVRPRVEDK